MTVQSLPAQIYQYAAAPPSTSTSSPACLSASLPLHSHPNLLANISIAHSPPPPLIFLSFPLSLFLCLSPYLSLSLSRSLSLSPSLPPSLPLSVSVLLTLSLTNICTQSRATLVSSSAYHSQSCDWVEIEQDSASVADTEDLPSRVTHYALMKRIFLTNK